MNYFDTPSSSTVLRVGYDEEQRLLQVQFKGGTYEYLNVPPVVFEDLQEAPSAGKFINDRVKPNYNFRRV
jgi:hypothetical protein